MNEDQLDLGHPSDPGTHGQAGRPKSDRVSVCDLQPGTMMEGVYLLSAKETRLTKAGKPFLKLKLSDRTGVIDCTVWEDAEAIGAGLRAGDLVLVRARVSEYQGKAQVEASTVLPAPPGEAEPRDFLPST